jgi:hypothetical protein
MKYARLRIDHDPETLHPMHAFEMEHDRIEAVELCHWNTVFDDTNTFVFRVEGDPDPFRTKLEARPATITYSLTPASNGVFFCCVRDRVTAVDEGFIEAVAQGTLVVKPPVRFNPDGTTDVTLLGAPEDVEEAIDRLPQGMDVTVRSVGPYRRWGGRAADLTDRQRDAVTAAVEHGYYDSPREGSVADIADDLGVATGTAAEHLRKAEATIMRQVVGFDTAES